MKNLETGKDKIKKICDILKNETLEPAKLEAEKIIKDAQDQASIIISDAKQQASNQLLNAKENIQKERVLFEKQVAHALVQSMESLRQQIEERLFNLAISDWLQQKGIDEKMSAKLISALVEAIEKEGTSTRFSAFVGTSVNKEQVEALLADKILKHLQKESLSVGDFVGGVQLQLHDRKLTLDISDEALRELLGRYIRKDFRALLFQS